MKPYFYLSLALNGLVLLGAAAMALFLDRSLSFGGFLALLMFLPLVPLVLLTAASLLFLLEAARHRRRSALRTAALLQFLSPLPWLLLSGALQSGGSWFEFLLCAQAVCGLAGLLLERTL